MCQHEAYVYSDLNCQNNGKDWKGSPKHNLFYGLLERALWITLIPQSYFPTPKICHIKFDSVFDPSKDITMGIKGIRIIPGSCDPVRLTNPTSTRTLMVAYSSVGRYS